MLPLAAAGFHVVAPDQRGYGRTTGWDVDYDDDLVPFRMLNHVRDALGLVFALGHRSVAAVVGHDYGSPVAAWCALARPDVFRSVVLMSAPFAGPPSLPFDTANGRRNAATAPPNVLDDLAALARPRKHYQWYYSTREANGDMRNARRACTTSCAPTTTSRARTGSRTRRSRCTSWSAGELAKLPTYYVMDLDKDMAETVAPEMPSAAEIAACRWLTDEELRVYSARVRAHRVPGRSAVVSLPHRPARRTPSSSCSPAARSTCRPASSLARATGASTRSPATSSRCRRSACTQMRGCHLVEGAGHWVQQEQPERVSALLLRFLAM